MNRGVLYLMIGKTHSLRLLVSLHSLRKVYDGKICIFHTKDSNIAETIEASVPNITTKPVKVANVRRNLAYITKTNLHRQTPFYTSLYIDSDTLVRKNIDFLWPLDKDTVTLTAFGNWQTHLKSIHNRLSQWRRVVPDLVDKTIRDQGPAINTGVFAFHRKGLLLGPWHDLCMVGNRLFIPDEISMQLISTEYPHRILDDSYNCSPIHGVAKDRAVIWHGHGNKHLLEPMKSLWLTELEECLKTDYGKIASWATSEVKAILDQERAPIQ